MKVLISVDMEGISGVATRRETATGWPAGAGKGNDYERARPWMTADANAAIAGACAGGATEVLVADAHDGMLNLIWESLDPRAELIRGYEGRPAGMFQGVDGGCAAVLCVGYHARAADGRGVLSHTYSGPDILWDIRLNGEPASEARFNAAVAGELGAPLALITGDDVICQETRSWLPSVETATVKYALDRFTARCLPQPRALELIEQAAYRAVQHAGEMPPYRLPPPIELEMVFNDSSLAAAASRIPRTERCGDRAMRYLAPTAQEAHDVCSIALDLAGAVARRERL
ncbi:MAG TPA: M55 family metallopeptidase [Chloroflexota bacterium]|nr:M55 family metallopeptidase [Chloroflexota bacterium]